MRALKLLLFIVFLLFFTLLFANSFAQQSRVSVIGSSTAAGLGTTHADSSWVRRFSRYYKQQLNMVDTVHNLGVSSTTVYQGMPSSYTPPAGRPSPVSTNNATRAVNLLANLSTPANGIVIVNYPTNGYDGYSIPEIMTALQVIRDSVVKAGNVCYITTTQPRSDGNFATSAVKAKLKAIRDSIINRFGTTYTLNFWDGMYNPADTTILAAYSAGDKVHFNNTGHRILFERVVAKNIFDPATSGDYRSNVNITGLWSTASSWQRYDGINWVTATAPPDSTSGKITIVAGDSIRVNTATHMDQVIIESGAILGLFNNSSATTFTLNNGKGTDITVNGKLYISVNGTITGSGTIVNNSNGIMILRNQGILSVAVTNNGTMNISGTGNMLNTTFTNNGTVNLIDFTLNLNTSTFNNNGLFHIPYILNSYIATTNGTGTFNNNSSGIVYKSSTLGVARVNATVAFNNYGTVKGFGEFVAVYTPVNNGYISPGNNSVSMFTVNPALVSAKPVNLNINIRSGGILGSNYDQIKFSTIDTLNVKLTKATLNVIDNANDPVNTIYTIIGSNILGSMTGPFASVNLPSHFGNLSYNGSTITIQKLAMAKTWDGGAGTANWNDAANWNPDGVPSVSDNVSISTATSVNVNTSASCNELVLDNGSLVLSIQSGHSLTVNGKLTLNQGTLNINGQSLTLNGTLAPFGSGTITGSAASSLTIGGTSGGNFGTLRMTAGPNNKLLNFTLNRTGSSAAVSIGSNGLEVAGTITLNNGILNTGGNLTLLSAASGTGRIAAIASSADISGNVTVQRYIPAGIRRWIYLSSPVTSFNCLQLTDDIFITGPGGTANGFDRSSLNNASLQTYDETVTGPVKNGWITPSSASASIPVNKGMKFFYRGNRTQGSSIIESTSVTPIATTLDFTGTINKGNITLPVSCSNGCSADDGWNLVPNPYPSPIDWNAASGWTKTNISPTIYIWNGNNGTYSTWNGTIGTNGGSRYIPLGQAFYVKSSGTASLALNENVKTDHLPATQMFRSGNPELIRITMKKDVSNYDEAVIVFDQNFSSNFDYNEDGLKLQNTNFNISTRSKDKYNLAVNYYQTPTGTDTIAMVVTGVQGNYQLNINDIATLETITSIILEDTYTSQSFLLNTDTSISFSITADAASSGADRFRLIFNKTSAPLPLKLVSFTGKNNTDRNTLDWNTASEMNVDRFEIERMNESKEFEKIGTVAAKGLSLNHYNFNDRDLRLNTSVYYYRLKMIDHNGSYSYSPVVAVSLSSGEITISVFPNPVKESLNIRFENSEDIPFELQIYNTKGQLVISRTLPAGQAFSESVKDLVPGVYIIRLGTSGRNIKPVMFVKE